MLYFWGVSDDRLSTTEAAAYLGLAASTVRAYRARGSFAEPSGQQWGRPYWTTASLDDWQRRRPRVSGRPRRADAG